MSNSERGGAGGGRGGSNSGRGASGEGSGGGRGQPSSVHGQSIVNTDNVRATKSKKS